MQHLQKQPHARIHPDLIQKSRPCHLIILSFQGRWLHSKITKQPNQDAHEFDLRELAAGTVACAARPADEGTVASGWLLQVFHRTR